MTFPEVTKFWQGQQYRCMGAGVRTKKVAFVGVKVSLDAASLTSITQCLTNMIHSSSAGPLVISKKGNNNGEV